MKILTITGVLILLMAPLAQAWEWPWSGGDCASVEQAGDDDDGFIEMDPILGPIANGDNKEAAFQKLVAQGESRELNANLYAYYLGIALELDVSPAINEQAARKLIALGKSGQLEAGHYAINLFHALGKELAQELKAELAEELFSVCNQHPEAQEQITKHMP